MHGSDTPACDRGATNRSLCDVADQTGEGQTATDLENVSIGETNEKPTSGVLGEKDFHLPKPSPISKLTVIQEARLPEKKENSVGCYFTDPATRIQNERNHLLLTN